MYDPLLRNSSNVVIHRKYKGLVNVINKSIFGKVLLEIEKVLTTFSISDKLFSKLVSYCVPLGHTLVKSFPKFKSYIIILWMML